MVLNTLTVGAAVTPTIIETYLSHYLNRKPLRQKPTAHISYHEGLQLVREFLHYASNHTVDEVQAFTQQWVPVPHWVKTDAVTIPSEKLSRAADLLCTQLGPEGIDRVGGRTWWQWRRDNADLKAEWIEMRKDYQERVTAGEGAPQRIMMYIHGGAYYFGSVDEHRYQMQRHARKLKARVLAPRYRLAPQFPFPCGLQDSIATYLYLLGEGHHPSSIIVAGDSAGGGMVLSMLVTLRDQGIPLPAGGILLSPWADLTHSFPSLAGSGEWDYIPAHGFVHKPSISWPPPNADDMAAIKQGSMDLNAKLGKGKSGKGATKEEKKERARGYSIEKPPQSAQSAQLSVVQPSAAQDSKQASSITSKPSSTTVSAPPPPDLSLTIDGQYITIKDQIQLYAANNLITHPLVSPILQPTLGGLPPLLVQVGGGELLRDEQIYLAHKAAHPMDYLPDLSHLTEDQKEHILSEVKRYGPTDVKLEVWDDLCHVAPTLSFTRPAKFMYRSIAQFGAWALARAQKITIDIEDSESISISSSSEDEAPKPSSAVNPSDGTNDDAEGAIPTSDVTGSTESVGRAGDPIPSFRNHMIRQRIDRHGVIRPLEPASEIPALQMSAADIGVIKEGPVRKWMAMQQKWATKFAREKRSVQKKRIQELAAGYEEFPGETPPPTALAGRRLKDMPKLKKVKKSWAMAMWSGWGSKHDQTRIELEKRAETSSSGGAGLTVADDAHERRRARSVGANSGKRRRRSTAESRSRSLRRAVSDQGQSETTAGTSATDPAGPVTASAIGPAAAAAAASSSSVDPVTAQQHADAEANAFSPAIVIDSEHANEGAPPTVVPSSNTNSTRPTREGIAYPFKLAVGNHRPNPSTTTLISFRSERTHASGEESNFSKEQEGNEKTEEGEVEVKNKHESAGTWAKDVTARVMGADGVAEEGRKEKTEKVVESGEVKNVSVEVRERPEPERFVTAQEF